MSAGETHGRTTGAHHTRSSAGPVPRSYHRPIAELRPSPGSTHTNGAADGCSGRMASVRTRVGSGLERVGLARPTSRIVEWMHTFGALPELISNPRRIGP